MCFELNSALNVQCQPTFVSRFNSVLSSFLESVVCCVFFRFIDA